MRIELAGDGDPEIAVVAALHGDERCGTVAIDRLLAGSPSFERPVLFVVANEEAAEANVRFLDEDLNRAFPGNAEGETHESRLAARLLVELSGCSVLDFHSTRSYPDPFVLFNGLTERSVRLVRATGVERAVDIGYLVGDLIDYVDGVTVECGLQGSGAAERNAERILRNFLGAMDALPAAAEERDPELFRMFDAVEGAGYEFVGENFVRVEAGEVFARKDGNELRADRPFYPVLMSTEGYEEMVGFRAERLGRLSDVA